MPNTITQKLLFHQDTFVVISNELSGKNVSLDCSRNINESGAKGNTKDYNTHLSSEVSGDENDVSQMVKGKSCDYLPCHKKENDDHDEENANHPKEYKDEEIIIEKE